MYAFYFFASNVFPCSRRVSKTVDVAVQTAWYPAINAHRNLIAEAAAELCSEVNHARANLCLLNELPFYFAMFEDYEDRDLA